jgi:hypothetical protein
MKMLRYGDSADARSGPAAGPASAGRRRVRVERLFAATSALRHFFARFLQKPGARRASMFPKIVGAFWGSTSGDDVHVRGLRRDEWLRADDPRQAPRRWLEDASAGRRRYRLPNRGERWHGPDAN